MFALAGMFELKNIADSVNFLETLVNLGATVTCGETESNAG
jgi:hypothetical protein